MEIRAKNMFICFKNNNALIIINIYVDYYGIYKVYKCFLVSKCLLIRALYFFFKVNIFLTEVLRNVTLTVP